MFFPRFLALPDYKDVLVFFHRFTVVYKPLWMLSGHEKDVVNYDLFIKNTAIWKEKNKREKKPTYAHVKNLNFSYENPDWAATRQVVTHSSTKICLFQAFCIISSIFFPFKLLLVCLDLLYLPPHPKTNQYRLSMMWSTLHISLYRKALRIISMGDQRRGRE